MNRTVCLDRVIYLVRNVFHPMSSHCCVGRAHLEITSPRRPSAKRCASMSWGW